MSNLVRNIIIVVVIVAVGFTFYLKDSKANNATSDISNTASNTNTANTAKCGVGSICGTNAPNSSKVVETKNTNKIKNTKDAKNTKPTVVKKKEVAKKNAVSTTKAKVAPKVAPKAAPQKAVVKKLPKFLELGSVNCRPCQMMQPIVAEIEKEYKGKLEVEFIDVWLPENENVAQKYKISSIPVQIFFDENGKEVYRHIGYFPKEDILKAFENNGINLK